MKAVAKITKTAVCTAASDPVLLRRMLAASPDLVEDPRLLSEAALHGRAETAKLLLAAGADPDGQVVSHEYFRPLHRAIEHRGCKKIPGHREVAERLLNAGASLGKRAMWMQLVPLAVAGMAGDEEMISLLIARKAEVNIFTAAITADVKKVRAALRKQPAASKDGNNMTVLHYAALSGLASPQCQEALREITEMLLDAGADGDARENVGAETNVSVLRFAAARNRAVAGTLLERGGNPDYGFGFTLWKEPGPMAELFLAHGANVNGRERNSQPFLNSRIHWNLPGVALWLLEKGADPTLTDKEGNTALHETAIRGVNLKVVEALLKQGAKKNAKNKAGETALDIARAKKRDKIAGFLESAR